MVLDALPVAALVAPEGGAVDAQVVAGVAVGEAVDEELVDHLVAPVADVRREVHLTNVFELWPA